jgi:hypothetical protein
VVTWRVSTCELQRAGVSEDELDTTPIKDNNRERPEEKSSIPRNFGKIIGGAWFLKDMLAA